MSRVQETMPPAPGALANNGGAVLAALRPSIQACEPVLTAIEAGLLATDPQGRVIFASRVAEDQLRKDRAALLGARLDSLFPGCLRFDPDGAGKRGAPYILRLKWLEQEPLTAESAIPAGQDSPPRHVRLTVHPHSRDGQPAGALVVVQDNSKPKELEEQLRRWHKGARDILDGVNAFLWESRNLPDGRCIHFSTPSDEAFHRVTGHLWRDLFIRTGRIVGALEYPDTVERDEYSRRAACGELDEYYREFRLRRGDGAIRWAAEKVRVAHREPDLAIMSGVLIDITERKEAEERLRQSELRHRGLVETQQEVITRVDHSLRLQFVNRAFCEMFGIAREQAANRSFLDFLEPETAQEAMEVFRQFYTNESRKGDDRRLIELPMAAPAGRRWIQWEAYAIRNAEGCVCEIQAVGRDITEQKRQTEALRQSEERYRGLIESQQDLILRCDMDSRITYANDVFCRMLGRDAAEIIGLPYVDLVDPADVEIVWSAIRGLQNPPFRVTTERRFATPAGDRIIEWENCGIRDENGVVVEMQAIGRDITGRKRMEEALRRSEERYRGLIESQQDLILRVDQSARVTFVNNALCRKLGKRRDELLGAAYMQYVHEGDIERARRMFDEVLRPPYRVVDEIRIRTPQGVRWIQVEGYAIRDENGAVVELQASGRDVTDRKDAEQKLQDSEARLRKIIDMTPVAIFLKNAEGRFLLANIACAMMHHTTLDRLVGRLQKDFPELQPYIDVIREEDRQVIEEGRPVVKEENLFIDSSGRRHYCHVTKFPYELPDTGERVVLGVVADYTDLKLAQDALRESESRYRGMIESQTDLVIRVDPDGRLTFVNDAFSTAFGVSQEEAMGRSFQPYIHPHDLDRAMREIEAVRRPPHRNRVQHRAVIHGQVRWLEWENCAIIDKAGALREVQSVGRDITERKRAREIMSRHAARSQTLARIRAHYARDFQPDDVIDTCVQAVVEEFKHPAAAVFRIDGNAICPVAWRCVGEPPSPSVAFGYETPVEDDPCPVIRSLRAGAPQLCADLSGARPSEFSRWAQAQGGVAAAISPFRQGGRLKGALAVVFSNTAALDPDPSGLIHEITQEISRMLEFVEERERRARAEQHLIQEQKDLSIATLAGGIAHDFNNILMSVTGCVDLLEDDLPPEAGAHKHCRIIAESAGRMAQLTRHLLNYARGGSFFPQPVDVAQAFNDTLAILGPQIPSNVRIQIDLAEDASPVLADASQFLQALMNLLLNACESMAPDGGTLAIAVVNERRERWESEFFGALDEGEYVRVTVRDTGCGMNPDTLRRIYEPFFSTKVEGRGMGLAAVYGIVRGHKACIEAESRSGEGTTFHLIWPRANFLPDEIIEAPSGNVPIPRDSGVVLLVEDEETPRLVATRMLERIGYAVHAAGSGSQAMEVFRRLHAGIDLAIIDLQMPEMDGRELLRQLRELDADLPVLIATGHDETTARSIGAPGERRLYFLHKPYDIRALAFAARKAINADI